VILRAEATIAGLTNFNLPFEVHDSLKFRNNILFMMSLFYVDYYELVIDKILV
jgi:hypothetical protein